MMCGSDFSIIEKSRISKNLKEVRVRRGLTLSEIGQKANLSVVTIWRHENEKQMSFNSLRKISNALEIPYSLFFRNPNEFKNILDII